jgi:hypothetical protein
MTTEVTNGAWFMAMKHQASLAVSFLPNLNKFQYTVKLNS